MEFICVFNVDYIWNNIALAEQEEIQLDQIIPADTGRDVVARWMLYYADYGPEGIAVCVDRNIADTSHELCVYIVAVACVENKGTVFYAHCEKVYSTVWKYCGWGDSAAVRISVSILYAE